MTAPVSVRGGAGGIEAHYDDLTAAARLFGRAAGDMGEVALVLHGYLLHPAVVASAALDPGGAAEFEGRLVAALDGPHGVTRLAVRCTGVDVGLRASAAAYLSADRLDERLAPITAALTHAPRAIGDGATALARGRPGQALQRLLTDDPELVDVGVDLGGGLLGGSVTTGTWLLQRPFADGHPQVLDLGADAYVDLDGPPRSLADVLAGLSHRNLGRPGEIDVRLLTGADGHRRVIVDVPGTKNWALDGHNPDVTSLATNLRAVAGRVTTYERGVIEALRQAGVRPDDDILLVGHSEGGLVAINAARHLMSGATSREFHVSHVVTAGAPIGLIAGGIPRSVDVLALENDGDVVPHLDGATNPDRVNLTTATVHHDHGSVAANHDLDASYRPGAADVDASGNPSLRGYLAGVGGFLGAESVQTRAFLITRSYP